MKLLLASESLSRKRQLSAIGLKFQVFPARIDEEAVLRENRSLSPPEICLKLARLKAEKAARAFPDHTIIAADQLAFLGKTAFGKAMKEERAIEALSSLQGRTHHLIHGLFMRQGTKVFSRSTVNEMTMRKLSLRQIKNYAAIDRPLKSAGSYLLEKSGIGLFSKIKTEDFSSIIGLPLTVVLNQLIEWGLDWPPPP